MHSLARSAPARDRPPAAGSPSRLDRLPPQSFFLVSAVFHYLGPSLAVLLFTRVGVLGMTWLRIVTAAAVFAAWRRPWRMALRLDRSGRWVLAAFGGVLAAMNTLFYLAVDRLFMLYVILGHKIANTVPRQPRPAATRPAATR